MSGNVTDSIGGFTAPSLSVDASGNAMAVWTKSVTTKKYDANTRAVLSSTTTNDVKSARFLLRVNTWVPKAITKLSNGNVRQAALSADRFTNVNAVWTQYVGAYAKTISARYSATTGSWSTPRVIQSGNFNTRDSALATDPNGNVIATWSQRTDSGTGWSTADIYRTTVARYSAASGTWGIPSVIQDTYRNAYRPYIGVDNQGAAVLVWTQNSGRTNSTGAPIKEIRADRVVPR